MEALYQTEHNIIDILEQGSKILALSGNLPSQAEFKQIEEEYKSKVSLLLFLTYLCSLF